MTTIRPLFMIGLAFWGVAEVLAVVSYSTIAWLVQPNYDDGLRVGLYKICLETSSNKYCNDLQDVSDALHAVRALVAIGGVLGFFGCICVALVLYKMLKRQRFNCKLCLGITLTSIFANILLAIACAVYGTKEKDDYNLNFGHSFYLCAVASFCFSMGGWMARSDSKCYQNSCQTQPANPSAPQTMNMQTGQILAPPYQQGQVGYGQPQQYSYGQPQQYSYGQPQQYSNQLPAVAYPPQPPQYNYNNGFGQTQTNYAFNGEKS